MSMNINYYTELEDAMFAYIAQIEIDLIKEGSEEQADPFEVDGQYILDRLDAETDMLIRVAERVKAAMVQALQGRVMSYAIDYSTDALSKEAKEKAALKDIKEWLGAKKFNKFAHDVPLCVPPMTRKQFRFALSIAGVQGYPVEVWADRLGVAKVGIMSYTINRVFANGESRELKTGLTLEEAQTHCRDPETSSWTCSLATLRTEDPNCSWYDCYTEE